MIFKKICLFLFLCVSILPACLHACALNVWPGALRGQKKVSDS